MKTLTKLLFFAALMANSGHSQDFTVKLPVVQNPSNTVNVGIVVSQADLSLSANNLIFCFTLDEEVLDYSGTQFVNPDFPAIKWIAGVNVYSNIYTAQWFGGGFEPITFTEPTLLFIVNFTYLSGSTPLILQPETLIGYSTYPEGISFIHGCVGPDCIQTGAIAGISLSEIPVPSSIVNVPITITEAVQPFYGFNVQFNYDPTVMNFMGYGSINPLFPDLNFTEYGNNCLHIDWFDTGFIGMLPELPCLVAEMSFNYLGGTTNLDWKNNSLFFYGFQTNLINGCVGPGCAEEIIWTGFEGEDWFNEENWNPEIVPGTDYSVLIPETGQWPYPVISGQCAVTGNLIIEQNAEVHILSDGALNVNDSLIINGHLEIDSDEEGKSGSMICLGEITGEGTFAYRRHITGSYPVSDLFGWHYISAPVDAFGTDDIEDYFVNKFIEPEYMWQIIQGNIPCTPADPPVFLDAMQGWCVKLDPDYISNCGFGTGNIIDMECSANEIHQGQYSLPFTNSAKFPIDGWNLFGNPYPSFVDPGLINWPDELNHSIYLWDANLNTYFTWAGGVGPNIPPTQGFFVNAVADGTLTFTGNERIHDDGTTWFKSTVPDLLILKATDLSESFWDITYIRFLDEASAGFDKEWDAYKLLSSTTGVPQIYTVAEEYNLSINATPATAAVPVSFSSAGSGEFSISAIETSEFDNVFLEDIITNQITDLLENIYYFNYSIGDDPDRFMLHFLPLDVEKHKAGNCQIFFHDDRLIINSPYEVESTVRIFDLSGRQLTAGKLSSGITTIPFTPDKSCILVQIINDYKVINQKVIVQ